MYAFCSDVHVGNHKRFGGPVDAGTNARCCLILTAFDEAIAHALQNKCTVLFVAGDFLDYVRPEPQIIALVQETLKETKAKGLEVVFVLGDHEIVSSAKGDHALGPFRPVAYVVDEPRLLRLAEAEVACVPFIPGKAADIIPAKTNELFGKAPTRKGEKPRVLIFHAGVSDAETAPWLRDIPDVISIDAVKRLIEKHGIDLVVAGNFHNSKIWQKAGATVCQTGALVPTGWNNPGLDDYGGVALFSPSKREFSFHRVGGPRFVSVHLDDEDLIQKARDYPGPVYLQVVSPVDRLPEAQGLKLELLETFKESAVEIIPDKIDAENSARSAATVSRQQETTDGALKAYIEALTLPSSISKGEVLSATAAYLRKGNADR
jgi:DNA repair exonuclease SbcCD nuclease subunit